MFYLSHGWKYGIQKLKGQICILIIATFEVSVGNLGVPLPVFYTTHFTELALNGTLQNFLCVSK